MELEFKPKYFIGISLGLVLIIADLVLYFVYDFARFFIPIIVVGITIGWIQFWIDFYNEGQRQKKIELKFVEFTRSLVDNARSGVSIPKAIVSVSHEDFGPLSPYVMKLSKQMEWGIPVHRALVTFANDTSNRVIKRSVAIIIEADESGGDIADILDSVSESVVNIKKMKEERKSSAYSQIVQGYIVFFTFIGIMLILQLWLFPQLTGSFGGEFGRESLGESFNVLGTSSVFGRGEPADLDFIFISLIVIQGLFAGIMIGKFSEGSIKQGAIHSLILITIAILIITTAKGGI